MKYSRTRRQIDAYIGYINSQSSLKLGYHVWEAGRRFQLYVMDEEGRESRTLGHVSTGAGNFFM